MIHLVNGNGKLPKEIINFSLPPIITCPESNTECEKYCYAKKFYRLYPNVKKNWDENLQESMKPSFVKNMIKELKLKKWKICRIHVSGDFYDGQYARKWIKIIKQFPNKIFYAYTKAFNDSEYRYSFPDNFIIIKSLSHNNPVLFDNSEDINGFRRVTAPFRYGDFGWEHVSVVIGTKKEPFKLKSWFNCAMDCKKCNYCYNPDIYNKKIIFPKH